MKPRFRSALHALTLTTATPALALTMVGDAPTIRTKGIAGNAVNSKDRTRPARAVKAAGLIQMPKGQSIAGARQGSDVIQVAGRALVPG